MSGAAGCYVCEGRGVIYRGCPQVIVDCPSCTPPLVTSDDIADLLKEESKNG